MGWHNPPIPWKEFERRLSWAAPGAAARREPPDESGYYEGGQLRSARLSAEEPAGPPAPQPPAEPGPAWAELHCHSSYSFLDGASDPDALVAEAARLGVEALAVTDHDGMHGVVRLAEAAREPGVRTGFAAQLRLQDGVAAAMKVGLDEAAW